MPDTGARHNTGDSRPPPLTPPPCDLSGLEFMPLKLQTLFDSDFYALSSGDEFKVGLKLWGKSWHEKPAASLPGDEKLLAMKAGVALDVWRQLAPMALHKWVLCSDGRYYHPTVAREALKAWIERIGFRKRGASGAAARAKTEFDTKPYDVLKAQADQYLAALEPGAAISSISLSLPETLVELPPEPAQDEAEVVGKSAKGRDSGGERSRRDKNPSGSKKDSFFIDDGWTLDDVAIEDAQASGLSQAEIDAAATQHLEFWRGNGSRKTREGWAAQWRSRIDDIAEDPEVRRKLLRGRVKVHGVKLSGPPTKGPQWWRDAGAKLHSANAGVWTATWSRCAPRETHGVVVAASTEAAARINAGETGIDAQAVLGFAIRAIDPEQIKLAELARIDPQRARIQGWDGEQAGEGAPQ
jgi:hypothetical protein